MLSLLAQGQRVLRQHSLSGAEGKSFYLSNVEPHQGAKNMMGGRIYTHSLERLVPDFRDRAPLERKVTKERISIGTGNEMTTIEYSYEDGEPNEESYVVLRAKFDKWLAEEAEKKRGSPRI